MAYIIQLLKPALPLLCSMLCSRGREDGLLLLQIMLPLSLACVQRLLQYLQVLHNFAMNLRMPLYSPKGRSGLHILHTCAY